MIPSKPHDIRNIALVGQAGAGKTSLVEAVLRASGTIATVGTIERGDTVSDFDPLEKAMGHSLHPAVAHFEYAGHWVNLIDAPGTPDYQGRALAALEAVETAAIVVNAQAGIEAMTRRMMDAATGMCRLIIVNRIDAPGVDFAALYDRLTLVFGRVCLPVNLPAPGGTRAVDCLLQPEEGATVAFSSVKAAHDAIVDQVVELDDALMEAYLSQGESLTLDQLHDAFEAALRQGHLIPVCFVSAKTGAGMKDLLNVLGRMMPDPTEGNPPRFRQGEGANATDAAVVPDPDKHVVAHVYQIYNDAYRGKLGMFRVWQGTVTPNTQLYVGDKRKPFKVSHLFRLQGKEQVEVDRAIPGDICAISRVDDVHRDAVLHDSHDEDYLHLTAPSFPQPVFGLALVPNKHGDEAKLSDALHRIRDEDPCLATEFDPLTKETVVRGLGEAHLKTVLDQLKSRWNLQLDTHPPSVPYRETVSVAAEARYRHRKQSGGAGQFGEVAIKVEPLGRGTGFKFVDGIKGGVIPNQYIPAVEKGVRLALAEGAIAGYPIEDVQVTLFDGKFHAVDSNEISFVTAGRHALIDAVREARPMVLEPLMAVQVRLPDARFGDVSGDISSRRGRVTGTDTVQPGITEIDAVVPMAEMTGFEPRLKSLSGGEASSTVSFSHYEAAPELLKADLAKQFDARRNTADR